MRTTSFGAHLMVAVLLWLTSFSACAQPSKISSDMKPGNADPYKKEWKSIDSLQNNGLYKSALDEVEKLYARTLREGQHAQMVKALIYKMRFVQQLDDKGIAAAILSLQSEAAKAPLPAKAVLESMLGELLFSYYENQRYQIDNRTTVADFRPEDLQTWSGEQIIAESARYYLASVQHPGLAEVAIQQFDAVTTEAKLTDELRPTLFDLLAWRAIEHFSNERGYLTRPAYRFELKEAAAFADAAAFVQHDFATRDTASFHHRAVLLYQQWLKLRLSQNNLSALLDADLHRLRFAYAHSAHPEKEQRYKAALLRAIAARPREAMTADYRHELARWYYQYGSDYKAQTDDDDKKWAWKEALAICETCISEHAGAPGVNGCLELKTMILGKELSLQTEQAGVPGQAVLAHISYRNLGRAYLKVVPLKWEERDRFERWETNKDLEWLNKIKPVQQLTVELKNPGDYRQHSTEAALKALPAGWYAILVSDNDKFRFKDNTAGFVTIQVSNIAYLNRQQPEGGAEFVVVDRYTGAPMPGVKAEFFEENYDWSSRRQIRNRVGEALSNAEGFIASPDAGGRNMSVVFSKGQERLISEGSFSSYRNSWQRPAETVTHFFLDRAIYRPGQTVYFKALVINTNEKRMPSIVADQPVTITLRDANGQEAAKLELRTNRYGTVNGAFQAPSGGLLGGMSLMSSQGNSSHYFRVEEYKRPRFEVLMQPLEGAAALGEQVTVKGKAQAYAGSNVDGAKVQYRVVRETYFPWRYWWGRGGWFDAETIELANGETVTDADGGFSVQFMALPDGKTAKKFQPAFRFTVYADVTDINGETRSGEKSVQLAWQSLLASVTVPESVDRSEPAQFAVSTTNLDGQKQPAACAITLERLRLPDRVLVDRLWEAPDMPGMSRDQFVKNFPHLPYSDENQLEKLPVEALVAQANLSTGEADAYSPDLSQLPVGAYLITLKTKDAAGNAIESKHWFRLYDSRARQIPANTLLWRNPLKPSYQPGATLETALAGTGGPVHTLVEMDQDLNRLEKARWVQPGAWTALTKTLSESERGGFWVQTTTVRFNRVLSQNAFVNVPWSNKALEVEYSSFRDKLLPGQNEEWRIKIKGPDGERVAAEMVAAMYDASLDAFAPNSWGLSLYPTWSYSGLGWSPGLFGSASARMHQGEWNKSPKYGPSRVYRSLLGMYDYQRMAFRGNMFKGAKMTAMPEMAMAMDAAAAPPAPGAVQEVMAMVSENPPSIEAPEAEKKPVPPPPGLRTNLKETVFFLPDLMTDAEGNVVIRFTMNEALTRWKFLGLAHTTDLKTSIFTRDVLTQKDLMVLPNAPRFVREGDEIEFTAKVSNLTAGTLAGTARLELFDALSMQPVDALLGNNVNIVSFSAPAGQSAPLSWKLRIPQGQVMALTHRVTAQAGNYSDGEESSIPVLTNRMLVTETLPMSVRGGQTKTFTLNGLRDAKSPTLQHHQLTLEFTSNPAWYAVQALPYLMEYPYECIEQVFNRFYANTLAASVANSQPNIKKVFDSWKGTDALQSNLSKNQELKTALLQETPWVLAAQKESEQRQNIALLFDLHRMAKEQKEALEKIAQRQLPSGGFAWFNGGQENWYITQYVVEGLGHLRQLKALSAADNAQAMSVATKALKHIDEQLARQYEELEKLAKAGKTKLSDDHLTHLAIHYLYTRSFFPEIALEKRAERARDYYAGQAAQYWLGKGIYQQGLLTMALHRSGNAAATRSIVASLRERALRSEELGMYWKYDRGYFWYQMPIETHALMIEVFAEAAKDEKAVDELRLWLLKNKQTTNWKTTKATASAVYALLGHGDNWLSADKAVQVSFDKNTQRLYADRITAAQNDAQAGTGYFKTAWNGKEVSSDLATIKVKNPNKVVAWGSAYWQYFEDLDKIKTFEETPLTLKKQLFREEASPTGPVLRTIENNRALRPGDKLIVRIELRVDRDMEYVHMKDMRASGFEPINVLSQYKWQGGLGYYESTGDAATHFFFDYLPKGTYVFEYPLRAAHNGDFSNGITSIQCMYAPEFTSHSQGVRVSVGR